MNSDPSIDSKKISKLDKTLLEPPERVYFHFNMANILMSDRLEATRKRISPHNRSFLVQVYQWLHGNKAFARMAQIFTIGCIGSFLFHDIAEEELFRNLYMCLCYVNCSMSTLFWASNRVEAEQVLVELKNIARALEKWSKSEQLTKLIHASNRAKLVVDSYHMNAAVFVVYFVVYPALSQSLALSIRLLPSTGIWFWGLHSLQGVIMTVSCVAATALLSYHVEVTICLSTLLANLSRNFQTVKRGDHLNELIQKHQELLDTSHKFRVLFAGWTFIQVSAMLILLISNTFICIRGSRDPGIVMVIPVCLVFVYVFCFFGESLIVASEKVNWCVYKSNWLQAGPAFRRKLVMVIARSQTPETLDAGLLGVLNLPTFTKILRIWFKFVQALLNLL